MLGARSPRVEWQTLYLFKAFQKMRTLEKACFLNRRREHAEGWRRYSEKSSLKHDDLCAEYLKQI